MSLYTVIHFTPEDRTWLAPDDFIRSLASLLEIDKLDVFTVNCQDDASTDDEETQVLFKQQVAIDEALRLQRTDAGHSSSFLFPLGDFVRRLLSEVAAAMPTFKGSDFTPWSAMLSNGRWATYSYDEGHQTDGGKCAFSMSNNGYPVEMDLYLRHFLAVEGVVQLKRHLETTSGQPWTTLITLT